jgi:hypothetical protein
MREKDAVVGQAYSHADHGMLKVLSLHTDVAYAQGARWKGYVPYADLGGAEKKAARKPRRSRSAPR